MSLVEALVAVLVVAAGITGTAALGGAAARARAGIEQDLVGGLAVDGFLEEAIGERGRVAPFRDVRLGRFRWVRRFLPGAAPGPRVRRTVERGGVRIAVDFGGRVLEGGAARGGP